MKRIINRRSLLKSLGMLGGGIAAGTAILHPSAPAPKDIEAAKPISDLERSLIYFQLWRTGFPIDPRIVAESWNVPTGYITVMGKRG